MGEPRGPDERVEIVPISFAEACAFISRWHRHRAPPVGHKFSVAVARGRDVVGVAVVGRPIARHLDDGWTLEVTRVAVAGQPNGCSMLYATTWRATRAMGYRRLITYTRYGEPGTSLRAAGWRVVATVRAGAWSRVSRPRVDADPIQLKLRWEAPIEPEGHQCCAPPSSAAGNVRSP